MCQLPSVHPIGGQKITTNHVSTTISAPYEDRRSQRIMCQLPSVHPYEDRRSHRIMCQLPSVHPIRTEDHNESCVNYHQCILYEDRRSQRIMCQLPSVQYEDRRYRISVNYHQCILRGQKITTNHVSTTISAPYEDRRSQRIMCQLPSMHPIRGQKFTIYHVLTTISASIRGQKITTNHVSTTISASYTRTEDHNESCVNYYQCILRGQKITTNHVSTTISALYEDRRAQRIICQLPSVDHTRTEDHNESCVNYHQCIL